MTAVLSALGMMASIAFAGWLLVRTRVLGENVHIVLARIVFAVATPALLFVTVAHADLHLLLSRSALVAALSTSTIALVAALVLRLILRRSLADTTVATLSAAYVNAAILGLPLAVYLLGDALAVVPVLLFQLLVLAPIAFTVLGSRTPGAVRGVRGVVVRTFQNPIIVGALAGLVVAGLPWQLPEVVFDPFAMVGAAAAPLALLTFGMSMHTPTLPRPLADRAPRTRRPTPDLVLVVVLRGVVHPLVAYGIGRAVGMSGTELLAVVTMGALPTAQNIVVYAIQYGRGQELARNSGLITTVLALPLLLMINALLG